MKLFVCTFFVAHAQIETSVQVHIPNRGEQSGMVESVLHPFWTESQMNREPVLFVQRTGKDSATAQLLFPAENILSVTSEDGGQTFEQGLDYLWNSGSRTLMLTANSRIPSKTMAELHPLKSSHLSFGETADGKTSLFFAEGGAVFHSLQVNVAYQHRSKWNGYIPSPASTQLERTINRLRRKDPLRIVVLGDSISYGACASSMFHEAPYQPPYTELVAAALRAKYLSPVSLINLSVNGTVSGWGVTQISAIANEHPDLLVLAFGMNDASSGVSPVDYSEHIRSIMRDVRKYNPQVDFILVATMTGNPEWAKADQELYSQYRRALLLLGGPGVAVADLTSMWHDILKEKRFTDLTGNGINHPNDFGHSVYAQVIVSLLR